MNIKPWLVFVVLIGSCSYASLGNAATYRYSGAIVEATGAFTQLLPVGTVIDGYIVFANDAVQAGMASENDLLDLQIQVGLICVYLVNNDCAGAVAPIDSIDNVDLQFGLDGKVIGGEIRARSFVPSDPIIPWLFDFDANTLSTSVPGLGTMVAETTIVQVIPIPGAMWLFASASIGLIGSCIRPRPISKTKTVWLY